MTGLLVLAMVPAMWAGAETVNADASAIKEFEKKITAYIDLRKTVESRLPALKSTASPEKISQWQRRLGDGVRQERKAARPGDIFTPAIASDFRRLIAIAMESGGPRIRASLNHAEPVPVKLHINDSYPEQIPLQSTPPSLLANLPQLPRQMEYRLAGKDLILLDVRANVVVDLIANIVS